VFVSSFIFCVSQASGAGLIPDLDLLAGFCDRFTMGKKQLRFPKVLDDLVRCKSLSWYDRLL